jgi:hypothetical protein
LFDWKPYCKLVKDLFVTSILCAFVWLRALLQVCRICLTESLIASLLRICFTKHHCKHVENCLTKHCNMLKSV